MNSDMVFDKNHNPTWCDSPEATRQYLLFQLKSNPAKFDGYTVRIGWPQKDVTVEEYLTDGKPEQVDANGTEKFQTHAQELSENEEYARVFQLVISAMSITAKAVYHGENSGMDLLAIQTTRQILKQL